MIFFTDIQRSEAVAIADLLTSARRPEMIADALREGLTLSDVRRRLAAETAAAASNPRSAAPPRTTATDNIEAELEEAARARFAAQRAGRRL